VAFPANTHRFAGNANSRCRSNRLIPAYPAVCEFSAISRMELLSYPDLTMDEEQAINRLLDRMTHLAISPLIEDLTIQFRHQHRVKLPDAIIAATATAHGIKLLTLDKKLAVKL
jgi:predicted nucleic acid-binding protein